MAIRKIFVGSLPQNISDNTLFAEFGRYGTVEEVFIKPGCEPGRQWAFVTFATAEQAQHAKESCDRNLVIPGHDRACDVMLAKNQGMFGQQSIVSGAGTAGAAPVAAASGTVGRKIFVGSLPDGITSEEVNDEFLRYGQVEEVFMKANCEPGRQWAFVTYATQEEASVAVQLTHGLLQFPGSVRPCEVTVAKNQGLFGQNPIAPAGAFDSFGNGVATPIVVQPTITSYAAPGQAAPAGRKIFVGSLPDGISESDLRLEFSRYGQIVDIYLKVGAEPGRQWAFVTFATPEEALVAKQSCDRVLTFPGARQACEVTLAKNQGMFGQDPLDGKPAQPVQQVYQTVAGYQVPVAAAPAVVDGPRKIFVGSLPDSITDGALRAEFSRYGQVTDCFLKQGCESGRQWAFITFSTPDEAAYAKDATDRVLTFPGAEKACEVMLAKNQGKFGQNPVGTGSSVTTAAPAPAATTIYAGAGAAQPPPPAAPAPVHLTTWRMYQTAGGLPYYHNHTTGVTQWECPVELQVPGQGAYGNAPAQAAVAGAVRYAPY